MKLCLDKPVHLVTAGGNPGRSRGAKSNDPKVMDAVSLVAPSLWEFADRRQVVGLLALRVAAGNVSAANIARRFQVQFFAPLPTDYVFINILVSFVVIL
jgi:hypothetical protein